MKENTSLKTENESVTMHHSSLRKKRLIADATLLLVALLWGTTFAGSKYILDSITPLFIIAVRFVIATIIMVLLFYKKARDIQKENLKGGAILGTILFVAFAMQLIALQYTTAGKQSFLAGTYVVMVPFIAWVINRKRPDGRSFLGALICFLGIGLLTLNETLNISYGDGLTLFSSGFFAAHIIATGFFAKRQDVVKLTIVQFATIGILATTTAFIFEPIPTQMTTNGMLALLYLSVLCTAGAYFLQTVAQKVAIATHASIIMSLEAVFGSILAVILLSESFTTKMVIGCTAIFAAILISELRPDTEIE